MAAAVGNKYALGHGFGRPRKFESADELYSIGLKHIEETLLAEKPLTLTGMFVAMGILRSVFNDYESGKYDTDNQVFSVPLKELRLRVEAYAESRLFGNNPTGAIFALKNYGWKDVQTVEQTGPNGGPLLINQVSSLSEDDLRKMIEIMEKAALPAPEVIDIEPTE